MSEVAQTLCDHMDCSLPGSSLRGILQARVEWSGLPFPSPRDLPNPGIKPGSPALEADALSSEPPGKPMSMMLAVGYSYIAFIRLKKCPSILVLLSVFIIKEY